MTLPDRRSAGVVRSATGMGAIAAVSRVFGALRVLVVAAVLGTTYLGNAFGGSNSVSNVLFELLAAGALSAVLVPSFVAHFTRGDDAGAEQLARELLGLATIVLGAVALVGMLASPWLADLLTAAVDDAEVASAQRRVTTILLLFFMPQVVLYGLGAIATAVLHARRSFLVPAAAPIGNTVVMVAFLVWFRAAVGPEPGLDLGLAEIVLLGLGGTLGVAAFVAAPAVAAWRSGTRLTPRFRRGHPELGQVLRLSGWASAQHGVAALLLGAAIVVGGGVEGGVVAYQVGWFFFLAPYGIIAQPIHTTILPELVTEHGAGDTSAFAGSIRWALDSMCVLLLPLTAICVALAVPVMTVLAFGAASGSGVDLLAASLRSLGLGLLPYGAFFLLARVWYVLGDSRTPALLGGIGALIGVLGMLLAGPVTSGSATVTALGLAHSSAYLIASAALFVVLGRRHGTWAVPRLALPAAVLSGVIGMGTWAAYEWWSPSGRGGALAALVVLVPLALAGYAGLLRIAGVSVLERLASPGTAS